jgi:hypothetical protein
MRVYDQQGEQVVQFCLVMSSSFEV